QKAMRTTTPGGRELVKRPFQNIQVDFTEPPPVHRFKYLLVIIDHLTHCIKAFPAVRATAQVVSKILLEHHIPKYGVVNTIDSDRGAHFTSKILHETMEALEVKWRLRTPWHPQSSGKVERVNQTFKNTLTKLVAETQINWLKCLPLALLSIRTRPRADLGVSPYEAMFGLPYLTSPFSTGIYAKGENLTKKYVQTIAVTLEDLRKRGYLPQTTPIVFKIHSIEPGDRVLVKTWKD
ncbi:YI31B protein, partial [Climacteris rufus]|nr:YI31B protein [Climacteris rufus]